MENKVNISDRSVESAGLVKDYQDAMAEYIWNGFDAGATTVDISFNANEIDNLQLIEIKDNGSGINYETLSKTFGNFLDSSKKHTFQRTSYVHGNKGKGRYSFCAFAGKAKWQTTYFDEKSNNYLEYDILISKNNKDKYTDDNKKISKNKFSGTTVQLFDLFGITGYDFIKEDFTNHLALEFGWFLYLTKEQNYCININGKPLVYSHLIAESEEKILTIKSENGTSFDFKITFLRWHEKMGDEKFYFYFLDSTRKEIGKELTSYNNNAIDFHHSIYVESEYFNSFSFTDTEQGNLYSNATKADPVFKKLLSNLKELLKGKYKQFIRGNAADTLIATYEQNGIIPKFRNNPYELSRRNDLINVVKEIYCIEPKLFKGLNKEQQKISVGLINLLLDSDERGNIIDLIGHIVKMTTEEREELSKALTKTSLNNVTKIINLIENRYKVIELFRMLVFDLKKFTTEINHIQKVLEENYWIIGEQYHLISANESFNILLDRYIKVLNSDTKPKKAKVKNEENNRRPDIFLCRKHTVPDVYEDSSFKEENVMIELKRPNVNVSKVVLRQIEDYLDVIISDDQFNSQKRFWKFYAISNKVDDYVKSQYEAFKDKGKRYLVKAVNNYEIYALTWDDVFTNFNLRHKYLLDKLDFDKQALINELALKGISFSADGATQITKELIDLGKAQK